MFWTLTFKTTLAATFQIFLMGAVGFIFVKKNIIPEEGLNLLSKLLINFFFPLFTFHQLTVNFHFGLYPYWWIFPLISLAVTSGGYLIGLAVTLIFKNIEAKKEFKALIAFQNSGYIPLLMAATIFGPPSFLSQQLCIYIFLFLIGFDLVFWSLGVCLMTNKTLKEIHFKNIFSPPVISILAALALTFFNIPNSFPDAVTKSIKMFGDCALPLAMMIVGGNLAQIKISLANLKKEVWLALLAKLIVIPAIALGIVLLLKVPFLIGFLIMLETAVPCATSLSVVARHYRVEEKIIHQSVFLSHVVSILTLPIFLWLYAHFTRPF